MGENLFEEEFTIEALSQMGNPLEQLAALVDFEMFRPALEEVLVKKDCKTPAGRPQIDVVLMFKVIFLQRYYGLGDHQIQYQIIDRTSFRQFLGIHTVAEVPDEKTVWACKNRLAEDGTFDRLFDEFRTFLIKSKDRCRIEHIFGFVEGAMNGSLVRSIGMMRAKAANALTNLVYNIFRYVQINHYQPQLITSKG